MEVCALTPNRSEIVERFVSGNEVVRGPGDLSVLCYIGKESWGVRYEARGRGRSSPDSLVFLSLRNAQTI